LILAIFQIGFLIHGWHFLKLFTPDAPLPLIPVLIIIELFSYLIRAISLAVRLAANIMSGHVLFFIVISAMISLSYINF
jgi:F-type H+-transporting ATPase subunit a